MDQATVLNFCQVMVSILMVSAVLWKIGSEVSTPNSKVFEYTSAATFCLSFIFMIGGSALYFLLWVIGL